jgi:5'-nucleotidase/UDP-sugar diphosphatase
VRKVKNHKLRFIQIIFIVMLLPGLGYAFQNEPLRFTILHTNDEHSHLIPHPAIDDHPELNNSAKGGFARLAGAIDQIRNEKDLIEEPVLIFSGGDILGGSTW